MGFSLQNKHSTRFYALARAVLALLGLVAALSSMLVTQSVAEVGAVVALCSVAVLAGHAWLMPILTIAQLVMVALLMPMAVFQTPPDPMAQFSIYLALGCALPSAVLFHQTFPQLLTLLTGRTLRLSTQQTVRLTAAASTVLSIVLPIVLA